MNIILASTSAIRKTLMDRLEIAYNSCAPLCDENTDPSWLPHEIVTELSKRKVRSVQAQFSEHILIGSDCIASCKGRVLCKPLTHEAACEQLAYQSGQVSSFYTGLYVCNTQTGEERIGYSTAHAHFRTLSTEEITYYLLSTQPYSSSGSIKSESLGIALFQAIHSEDPTSIMGLPLILLSKFLRELGVSVLGQHH